MCELPSAAMCIESLLIRHDEQRCRAGLVTFSLWSPARALESTVGLPASYLINVILSEEKKPDHFCSNLSREQSESFAKSV